ncbi:hypothetical protein [Spirosoma aerolatum]|uniref:hypothetical protein n=1 Tax=Spirosoma aerolatum TaxID=1211326 RepID=UPI0009AD594D|nr:hypothetical protein [Spirosoma aerolatum]
MKTWYACCIACWTIVCLTLNSYGQADSTRVEISQEKLSSDSTLQLDPERTGKEKKLMKELFRRSRQEVTLIEIGVEYPYRAGIVLFKDPRPVTEQTSLFSLWAGIEHKLTPAWALMGGVGWQFSPGTPQNPISGSSWLSQAGINYYPLINKAIQKGQSANNFYRQFYITTRALLPFHDKLSIEGTGPSQKITVNPFRQATLLGIGIHSIRTRFYFYNLVAGAAYLYGRDEGIRYPVQAMVRFSFGLGL